MALADQSRPLRCSRRRTQGPVGADDEALDRDVQRSSAGRRAQREQVAALVQVWCGRFGDQARVHLKTLERGTLGQGDTDGDGTRKIRNGERARPPPAGGWVCYVDPWIPRCRKRRSIPSDVVSPTRGPFACIWSFIMLVVWSRRWACIYAGGPACEPEGLAWVPLGDGLWRVVVLGLLASRRSFPRIFVGSGLLMVWCGGLFSGTRETFRSVRLYSGALLPLAPAFISFLGQPSDDWYAIAMSNST